MSYWSFQGVRLQMCFWDVQGKKFEFAIKKPASFLFEYHTPNTVIRYSHSIWMPEC